MPALAARAVALLLAALVGAAGAWHWQANKYERTLSDLRTEYATAQARALEIAHADTIRLQAQASQAAADAADRQRGLVAERERLRADADGLRHDLATARQRLPSATPAAAIEYASTASAVFAECTAEVERLAAAADGHASDARALIEAWPR